MTNRNQRDPRLARFNRPPEGLTPLEARLLAQRMQRVLNRMREVFDRLRWAMRQASRLRAVCPEGVEKPEGTVCPTCFLRRSLTGECGCDE